MSNLASRRQMEQRGMTVVHYRGGSVSTHYVGYAFYRRPTIAAHDYATGHTRPRYPVPALFVDSIEDLGERWTQWVDDDALTGIRW